MPSRSERSGDLLERRLLVVSNGYPPLDVGGVQEATYRSVEELRRLGWNVEVFVLQAAGHYGVEDDTAGAHRILQRFPRAGRGVISLAGDGLRFLWHFPGSVVRTVRLARRFSPDLIVVHLPLESGYYALFLSWLLRRPLVTHLHGWEIDGFDSFGPFRRWVVLRALKSSSRVLSNSQQLLDKATVLVPSVGSRSSVVGNGVAIEEMRRDARSTEPLISEPYLFAYGRLVERKGFDVLLAAFRLLKDELQETTPWLVLAGGGPEEGHLTHIAHRLGIDDRLILWGMASRVEVSVLLRHCLACAVPSREEGFGIVLLEAMAMGAPIVASRCGGIPEIIQDGRTGLLVEPDNPVALYQGLMRLVRSPDLREMLARVAQREVESRWGWKDVAGSYVRHYTAALSPSQDQPRVSGAVTPP